MKIYTVIRKGEGHPVYCEDYLYTANIGGSYGVYAISDGCSSGKESHFASALVGKILKKIINQIAGSNFLTIQKDLGIQDLGKYILKSLFQELAELKEKLSLNQDEMLATLVLMVYDMGKNAAFIIAIGDGVVVIDGDIHSIDQNNQPDYLAYHLEQDFENWFKNQKNTFLVDKPKEISICSDGIETFRSAKNDLPENFSPLDYLLFDNFLENNPQMLSRKCNILQTKHACLPYDDVSIIRIKF